MSEIIWIVGKLFHYTERSEILLGQGLRWSGSTIKCTAYMSAWVPGRDTCTSASHFPALLDLEGHTGLDASLCGQDSPAFRPKFVLCLLRGTQLSKSSQIQKHLQMWYKDIWAGSAGNPSGWFYFLGIFLPLQYLMPTELHFMIQKSSLALIHGNLSSAHLPQWDWWEQIRNMLKLKTDDLTTTRKKSKVTEKCFWKLEQFNIGRNRSVG